MRSFWMGFRDGVVEFFRIFRGIDWYTVGEASGVLTMLLSATGVLVIMVVLTLVYL